MRKFLGNAFSLQMLSLGEEALVKVAPLSKDELVAELKEGFISAVGHADTASVLSEDLLVEIDASRLSLTLERGDILFVAQLTGGRLPEGSTSLPEGFSFAFLKVELV